MQNPAEISWANLFRQTCVTNFFCHFHQRNERDGALDGQWWTYMAMAMASWPWAYSIFSQASQRVGHRRLSFLGGLEMKILQFSPTSYECLRVQIAREITLNILNEHSFSSTQNSEFRRLQHLSHPASEVSEELLGSTNGSRLCGWWSYGPPHWNSLSITFYTNQLMDFGVLPTLVLLRVYAAHERPTAVSWRACASITSFLRMPKQSQITYVFTSSPQCHSFSPWLLRSFRVKSPSWYTECPKWVVSLMNWVYDDNPWDFEATSFTNHQMNPICVWNFGSFKIVMFLNDKPLDLGWVFHDTSPASSTLGTPASRVPFHLAPLVPGCRGCVWWEVGSFSTVKLQLC